MSRRPEDLELQIELACKERDRYKRERNDLLAALFTSYDTRLHLSAIILLGADENERKLDNGGDTQTRRPT